MYFTPCIFNGAHAHFIFITYYIIIIYDFNGEYYKYS